MPQAKEVAPLFWGRIDYEEAWEKQKSLVDQRIRNEIPDTLIFCEHEPVITLGRGAQRGEKAVIIVPPGEEAIPVLEVERGGLATYHGPGQLVIYPIFKLGRTSESSFQGVLSLIRSLEAWLIDYLREMGLKAGAVEGKTGVWVDGERKIASIGIAARHWISYHGLSLNVSTGSAPWRRLNPCGFDSSIMTDLSVETKTFMDVEKVQSDLWARLPRLLQKENKK